MVSTSMKRSLQFVRWILLVLLLLVAYVNLNAATFHGWQTAAPPGYENPGPHAYAAGQLLGNAVSLCLFGSLLFLNIRVGWPYLRSRYTLVLAIGVVVAFVWPRASHFVPSWAILAGNWRANCSASLAGSPWTGRHGSVMTTLKTTA